MPIANLSVASWVLIISLFGFGGCSEILWTHDDTMCVEKFNQYLTLESQLAGIDLNRSSLCSVETL